MISLLQAPNTFRLGNRIGCGDRKGARTRINARKTDDGTISRREKRKWGQTNGNGGGRKRREYKTIENNGETEDGRVLLHCSTQKRGGSERKKWMKNGRKPTNAHKRGGREEDARDDGRRAKRYHRRKRWAENMRKGRRESVYDETASNRESPKGNERVHHEG